MRFAKWVFLLAGVSGLPMVAPLYLEDRFFRDYPPAINRPEFYYGFAGVTLGSEGGRGLDGPSARRFNGERRLTKAGAVQ